MQPRPRPASAELPPLATAGTSGLPSAMRQGAAVLLLAAIAAVWPMSQSWAATRVAEPASAASGSARATRPAQVTPAARLVDINTASRTELMKLPGIGAAEADAIVAGRPYLTKADLATNKVLPTGFYLSLRRSIVALPAAKSGVSTGGKAGAGVPAVAAPGASRKP